MHEYKDLPRCLMDYVRGAYKRALEKNESTLPFALLKAAVDRARTALNVVAAPTTIHVKPQHPVAHGSKTVDAGESRATEGQEARKVLKGKGKAKAAAEDTPDHHVDRRQAERHGRSEEVKGGDPKGKKVAEKKTAAKPSRGRTGTDVARHAKNDPPVPKAAKGTAAKVPYVVLIKQK